jgi:hypothetical protein
MRALRRNVRCRDIIVNGARDQVQEIAAALKATSEDIAGKQGSC